MDRRLSCVALGWAVAVSGILVFGPALGTIRTARLVSGDGSVSTVRYTLGLTEDLEAATLAFLAAPALLCLVAVGAGDAHTAATAAVLLLVLCMVGAASVGTLYLPSVLLLGWNAVRLASPAA